ncbi:hypothetical protein CONCODRAFT_8449 [Conidiobolus coronatus NRRL 28638]|uniref:Uncharacterized protein n=1 Tax=Conidiobolus coronatus (strain ATCC 28846 / CBS 209.66 / NRRL 28638) TaxID=796925 RepID=A0A137P2L1_CONC2|nr:hypothetical protein CONCODRAFT_8449 [Conidiobolus coronatus NRRL 28638]|eukprot:KXN69161.1 hypothetical protein CONCODRAFT_8449 [Conidiobolus coronatus NRRL 28638]
MIKINQIGLLEADVINMSIILIVFINSIAMYFTLKIFSKIYLFLLLACTLGAMLTNFGILMTIMKLKLGKISAELMTNLPWILYTQSYLYFLTSYYRDLLQKWQIRLCYLINSINLAAQATFTAFYSFKPNFSAETNNLALEISENVSATSTILSETLLTIWIFTLIYKISKLTINREVKRMLVKVILTMVLMWLMDIVVIYLEYGGKQQVFAYLTKPMFICFKFYIELLILGNCKKHLFMVSGMNNW